MGHVGGDARDRESQEPHGRRLIGFGNSNVLIGDGKAKRVMLNTTGEDMHTFDITGNIVFNEQGDDLDVRMEGDTDINTFFLEGSTNRIGILTNAPERALHVSVSTTAVALFENITTNTATTSNTIRVRAVSTNSSISAAFGAGIHFEIGDTGKDDNIVFAIAGTRDAADDTGRLFLIPWSSGSQTDPVVIMSTARIGIRNTAPGADIEIDAAGSGAAQIIVNSGGTSGNTLFDLREAGSTSNRLQINYIASTNVTQMQCVDGGSNGQFNFFDDLDVNGTLSKGSGTFVIDHPDDPFNQNLIHQFVESPESRLMYLGTVMLEDGLAAYQLEEYYKKLAIDAKIFLQAYGEGDYWPDPLADGDNTVTIHGTQDIRVDIFVCPKRNDRFIQANPDQVEVPKKVPGELRHPQVYCDRITEDTRYTEACLDIADVVAHPEKYYDDREVDMLFCHKVRNESFHPDFVSKYKLHADNLISKYAIIDTHKQEQKEIREAEYREGIKNNQDDLPIEEPEGGQDGA